MPETFHLNSPAIRARAKAAIDAAPDGWIVRLAEPKRSGAQNARFWAMLTDISRSKPHGREMTPERWKAAIMQSFGHAVQFENDLEGRPFPIGHRSSNLTVREMGDMMEFMAAHFTPLGVRWSEPNQYEGMMR